MSTQDSIGLLWKKVEVPLVSSLPGFFNCFLHEMFFSEHLLIAPQIGYGKRSIRQEDRNEPVETDISSRLIGVIGNTLIYRFKR